MLRGRPIKSNPDLRSPKTKKARVIDHSGFRVVAKLGDTSNQITFWHGPVVNSHMYIDSSLPDRSHTDHPFSLHHRADVAVCSARIIMKCLRRPTPSVYLALGKPHQTDPHNP